MLGVPSVFQCVVHKFNSEVFDPTDHIQVTNALQTIMGHALRNGLERQQIISNTERRLMDTIASLASGQLQKPLGPRPELPDGCFVMCLPSDMAGLEK
jgi:hypothetical protein